MNGFVREIWLDGGLERDMQSTGLKRPGAFILAHMSTARIRQRPPGFLPGIETTQAGSALVVPNAQNPRLAVRSGH